MDSDDVSSPSHGSPRSSALTRYQRIRHALVTPELIYGTIITSAVIVVAEDEDSDFDVFLVTVATMIVFWAAHVFAGTVASHGVRNGRVIGLREAFRSAVGHSSGLLIAAVVPLFFLVIGTIGLMDEDTAYSVSLWVGVAVLAVLGWLAFADRGSRWPLRLLGAVGTAFFGLVVILLKALLH